MTAITVGPAYAKFDPAVTEAFLKDLLGSKAVETIKSATTLESFAQLAHFNDSLGYLTAKEKLDKLRKQSFKATELDAAGTYLGKNMIGSSSYCDVGSLLSAVPAGAEFQANMMQVLGAVLSEKSKRARAELSRMQVTIEARADALDVEASAMLTQVMHILTPLLLLSTEERYQGAEGTEKLCRHIKRRAEEVLDSDVSGLMATIIPVMLRYDNKLSAMDKAINAFKGKTWEEVKATVLAKVCNQAYGRVVVPTSPAGTASATDHNYVGTVSHGSFFFKRHERTPNGVQFTASEGYSDSEIVVDVSANVDRYMTALLG